MRWRNIASLVLAVLSVAAKAQTIQEQVVVKDKGDSFFLKSFRATFDTAGNYYFETMMPGKGERFALNTKTRTLQPVYWSQRTALSPYKALLSDAFFADSLGKRLYYKNKSGTKVYGPHAGRIRNVLEYGRDNLVAELCIGNRSYLYVNDSMVNEADSLRQLWLCAFSDNGHCLYTVYKKEMFRLYLDHKEIDSAESIFSDISVNNNGFYTYVKKLGDKYYAHTTTGRFGPYGSIDYSDLWNSNAYYFRGCADSQCFILVNNRQYNHIPEPHFYTDDGGYRGAAMAAVMPKDTASYMFAYNRNDNDGFFVNMNGKETRLNYSSISDMAYDKQAGYALYGYRADSLGVERTYRCINGVESKLPPFRRARYKPHALQIHPAGGSVFYYETADSIYLFRNDTLTGKPVQKRQFSVWTSTVLPQAHPEGLEHFTGINMGDRSYIAYNARLSAPLPLINTAYDPIDEPTPGCIADGDINANGYYVIVCTAPGKYQLLVNGNMVKEISGIDRIIAGQGYLTANSVIFFGAKGNTFNKYTVNY